jgi:alpha-beta hydrolase superfamily lysophospholipase
MSYLVSDLDQLVRLAEERHPGARTFLLGHSMGSLVAASFVAASTDPPDGLILSGYAGLAGPAILESMTDPASPSIPAEATCRDPEVVKAYVSDELVFYDRVPVECNAVVLEAAIAANQSASAISIPTLMVHGSADLICDIEGAREFHEALASPDKELLVYEGLYHEVMNEPERDRVVGDIVAWLDRHTNR